VALGGGLGCASLQGIVYQFESLEVLASALESGTDDRELALPCREGVEDGEWLLISFTVDDEATSVAGRVRESGGELCITFEERDWERLLCFARGDAAPSIRPPARPSVPELICAPPGTTALLLDADATVLSIVHAMLSACGVATETARRAEEALELLRIRRYDVVVMEPALDGMSGLELCRRVKGDARLSDVPILVLSSHSADSDVRDALCAGADDFVGKPFRAHELRARVLGLLHRARPEWRAPAL